MDRGRVEPSGAAHGDAPAAERPLGVVDVLAFVAELAVFALLAVSGWRLFDAAGLRLAAAVLLPVAAIVVWGRWLAPRSGRRLPQPLRLGAQLGVFAATAAVAVAAGLAPVGWALPGAAGVVFAAVPAVDRRRGGAAGRS